MWNATRKAILPRLNPIATKLGRPLIRDKTNADTEWIHTTELTVSALRDVLADSGFYTHPISTLKYRDLPDERIYESLSMVKFYDNRRMQVHVYVFDMQEPYPERAIYCHYEPSIFQPKAHQNWSDVTKGDPDGRTPF